MSITRIPPPPPGTGAILIPDKPIIIPDDITSLPELGSGGEGRVFELSPELIVKDFHNPNITTEIATARQILNLRAQNIFFPNMPEVVQVDEARGIIVYERAPGETLNSLLSRHPGGLPEGTAIDVALGVAKAVEGLTAQGLVHRDIKPANILVEMSNLASDGTITSQSRVTNVRLIDIGILIPEGTNSVGKASGTLSYMSPEQFMGEPVGARSDVYQIGRVLFNMLAGRHVHGVTGDGNAYTRGIFEFTTGTTATELVPLLQETGVHRSLLLDTMSPSPESRPSAFELVAELRASSLAIRAEATEVIPRSLEISPISRPAPKGSFFVTPEGTMIMPEVTNIFVRPEPSQPRTLTFTNEAGTVQLNIEPAGNGEAPTVSLTPRQPVSRLTTAGRTAAGFGLPLLASLGTVEALQALGVDPAEHRGLLALAGIGSGHGAFVGLHRVVTGALPSAAMQAKGLGIGLPAGFFASGIYNSFLNNVVEADADSWSRSFAPQVGVGVGGGYGYMALAEAAPAALIALPFMVCEVINQIPSHIYSERTYRSRESAIDQAKMEMARAWNEDDDVLALGALFLSEIPIFTHLPDFFITGDDE